jgi:hypothetical protein
LNFEYQQRHDYANFSTKENFSFFHASSMSNKKDNNIMSIHMDR